MTIPEVILSNGLSMPRLGLGTFLSEPGEVCAIVKCAIDLGYRHFDCAWIYRNEREVGLGLNSKIDEGAVKREELFVTTKLWNTFHEQEAVVPALKESLKNLGLKYVDLYLIHWPTAQKMLPNYDWTKPFENSKNDYNYDYVKTWKGMEECVKLGLAKSIGVSNFNSRQLEKLLENTCRPPVCNQIEVNPLLNQKILTKFCKDRDIQIVAYSPFAAPARTWKKDGDPTLDLNDCRLVTIGKKYKKSGSQVVLRYLIQLGTNPIPKTVNKERLKNNMEIFDFELTEEDMKIMDGFDCNGRTCDLVELRENIHYPFRCPEKPERVV